MFNAFNALSEDASLLQLPPWVRQKDRQRSRREGEGERLVACIETGWIEERNVSPSQLTRLASSAEGGKEITARTTSAALFLIVEKQSERER